MLLSHVLGAERTHLLAHPERVLTGTELAAFEAVVQRRARGEPVAYIRGLKEFHGLAFTVDDRVLIPRPETEMLVDLALARIRGRLAEPTAAAGGPIVVGEVGTGSGAIAISLATILRSGGGGQSVRIVASDLSAAALEVAAENAVAHGVADRIAFLVSDLLGGPMAGRGPFDYILANLPYVPTARLPELPVAAHFEPPASLDGGPDGTALIRRLLEQLPSVAGLRAEALLEIGSEQADLVRAAVRCLLPDWTSEVLPDLAGEPRVLHVRRGEP